MNKDILELLSIEQKALAINIDADIYGSFSEIGAGQETVRYFFRAGGASKTVAKAMSAYDKKYSDAIYGKENDGRYVTQNRLEKMLHHEWALLIERLAEPDNNKAFFTFANTVTTINYTKDSTGHGWLGLKFFKTKEQKEPNTIILHINLYENDTKQQQETIGKIGVNMIYGAYHAQNIEMFLLSLYDNIDKDKFGVDVANVFGPCYKNIDNNLASLILVKHNMAKSVCFNSLGHHLLTSDIAYKKNILIVRGTFRPVTKLNLSIAERSLELFIKNNPGLTYDNTQLLFEITFNNLLTTSNVNEEDFLNRTKLLSQLGKQVLITRHQTFFELIDYMSKYTTGKIATGMGIPSFIDIFNETYYSRLHGGVLEAIGTFYQKQTQLYVYPTLGKNNEIVSVSNINLTKHQMLFETYLKPLTYDITSYEESLLAYLSKDILQLIQTKNPKWKELVPTEIISTIEKEKLFQ